MATKMTDLPADIASMITNNLKHDPIYLIKYKHIETSLNDDYEDPINIDHQEYVKLLTFKGGPDDCKDIFCGDDDFSKNILSGVYDTCEIFSKMKTCPYLPAYVKCYRHKTNTPKKLADLLKPWTVIKLKNGADLIIIKELTRYA